MNQLLSIISIVFMVIANACGGASSNVEMATTEGIYAPNSTELKTEESVSAKRKLIKKGRVEFETENLEESRRKIESALTKYQGYIASDDSYNSSSRITNTLSIRVPSNHFDAFLTEATKGVIKFDSKQINVDDVTEEFLDIEARLKTKKELEQRYLDLLKQAKSVTEILEIEKQIGSLRADIESIEGRLKYLKDQVSLSTLNLTFYKSVPKQVEFGKKFANGFSNGWNNLIWFFVFLTNIWPFVLIIAGLIFWIRYRIRKRRKAKS